MVEDFCSVDCKVQGFAGSFVKAVGLQDTTQFEHKIPVNVRIYRVLLDNESFIFLAHCAFSFYIFTYGRAKIIVADVLMYYNILERIRHTDGGINLDRPGEHAGDRAGGKLRNPPRVDDPMNLIRLRPAKEG